MVDFKDTEYKTVIRTITVIKVELTDGPNTIQYCKFINLFGGAIDIVGSDYTNVEYNEIGEIKINNGKVKDFNSISIEGTYAAKNEITPRIYTADNNVIRKNIIHLNNTHFSINLIINDLAIQSNVPSEEKYCKNNIIDGNIIYDPWTGIMVSWHKDFHILNNFIYKPKGWYNDGVIRNVNENTAGYGIHLGLVGRMENQIWDANNSKIYNNTIYGSLNAGIYSIFVKNFYVINNIFYDVAKNGTSLSGDYQLQLNEINEIDLIGKICNNLYYISPGGTNSALKWHINSKTLYGLGTPMPKWSESNYETSPFVGEDPGLVDPENKIIDLKINAYSIDKGKALSFDPNYLRTSINGLLRPAGSGWELGAHETPIILESSLNNLANFDYTITDTATAFNNGRKIVSSYNNNYYHYVFESGGEIFFKNQDLVYNNNSKKLSIIYGNNSCPSITEFMGNLYVVWQRKTGNYSYDIYFSSSNDQGVSWNNTYLLDQVITSSNPLPVVETLNNNVLITYHYGTGGPTGIKSQWTNILSPTKLQWFSNLISSNYLQNPTLTSAKSGSNIYFPMATNNIYDNHIYYNYFDVSMRNWQGVAYGPLYNLSNIIPGTNYKNLFPSITAVPNSTRLNVAWMRILNNGVSENDYTIIHRQSNDINIWPNVYSLVYYQSQMFPSIASFSQSNVDIVFFNPSNNYIYKSHFNGSTWGLPLAISNSSKYPSLAHFKNFSKFIWVHGNHPPYNINLSLNILPLEENSLEKLTDSPYRFYSRTASVFDSLGFYISVTVNQAYISQQDGKLKYLKMDEVNIDNLSLTNIFDNLQTSEISLNENDDKIIFDYSIENYGIENLLSKKELEIKIDVINNLNNNKLISSYSEVVDFNNNVGKNIKKQGIVDLSGIDKTQNIKALLKVNKTFQTKDMCVSLGHIYDYRNINLEKQSSDDNASLKVNILNQNYPNPFNAFTNIKYYVPYRTIVQIKLYDILGREIETLLNEEKSKGQYEIIFNPTSLPSGVYFYRIFAGNYSETNKMILLK